MNFAQALLFLAAAAAPRATAVEVTNGNDSGDGSLRAALAAPETASGSAITFAKGFATVNIDSTLTYAGDGPLTILGRKKLKIAASGDFTLLEIAPSTDTVSPDVTIKQVSFQGIGGFSPTNQGDPINPGKGIFVKVPLSATGVATVDLNDVKVSDVAYHGIHVSDCDIVPCGNGSGGGGDGSDASVSVTLKDVTVLDVGNGVFDGDGVRVDERGAGDLIFDAKGSLFQGAGADGVELDEGDEGDVIATVTKCFFIENGAYCDFDTVPEAQALAPDCVEEDDGELELDLDDGFDIDEDGDGDLIVSVIDCVASDNLDEGFDFDEAGDGGIEAFFVSVEANDNLNEGIKCSEEDAGDADIQITNSFVNGNQDDGMQLESEDEGTITVTIRNTECNDSRKSDLKVELPDGSSPGSLDIKASKIGCVETDNVDITPTSVDVDECD
ncbi:hypothetical protein ACHAXT_012711 [Thalassiosira profunda]